MEYVYAAMTIHKAGQKVTEDSLKKVLAAAGAKVDEAKVRALCASLEGVNIDEVIEKAAKMQPVAAAAAPAESAKKETAKAEKKEEKVDEGAAAAGLGALFG